MCVGPIVLFASSPELLRQKRLSIQDGPDDGRQRLVCLEDTLAPTSERFVQ
jgi:hypothetical protein